jgi:hypothetical protein
MVNVLYHLTASKNIDSIMKNGLIPDYTKGFARNKEKGWPGYPIWLTDSPQWIINKQLGNNYVLERDIQILQINITDIEVFTRTVSIVSPPKPSPYEFICFDRILPKYIKSIDTCIKSM